MEVKRFKNYITWKDNQGIFNTECNRASLLDDLALTIPTNALTKVAYIYIYNGDYYMRIRKLTPKECLRLMGFDDNDYQAARDIGMSDSAIYHMAGDSIITTCLMAIFGQLLPISEKELTHKINEYVERVKE